MKESIQITAGILFLGLIITIIVGWAMNIIDLIYYTGDVSTLFILKCIGIFVVPLGGVLGLIG